VVFREKPENAPGLGFADPVRDDDIDEARSHVANPTTSGGAVR
jgi:hypothetical protein